MTDRIVNPIGIICMGALWFLCSIQPGGAAIGQEPSISRIVDLMATPRDQLTQRNRVRVRGTVTLIGDGITTDKLNKPAARSFCIEDASASIWVRSGLAIRDGVFQRSDHALAALDYGIEIELEGYLEQGGFAPVILPAKITILGKGTLDSAPLTQMTSFFNFENELHRVTVSGVVQNVNSDESPQWWSLRVETGVGHFLTRVPREEQYAPELMLGAEVELTGVATTCWNWRSEFVCPRLIIAHRDDIKITKPANDPFSAEVVAIKDLDSFTPQGRPRGRRCIQGTVTYYDGDLNLYVQEGGIGIRVLLNEPVSIKVGDHVVVSGFIDNSHYLAGLQGALVRTGGDLEDPIALPMTINQVVEQHRHFQSFGTASSKSCDGRLIQLTGKLLEFHPASATKPNSLEIDCGTAVITAFLDTVPSSVLSEGEPKLLPGTELKVTGIAKLFFSAPVAASSLARPERIDLLLRGEDDIVVLSRPSWWTPRRTLNALLVVASCAVLVFLWAFTMQRTLSQRTNQLAREMRDRRDAAVEFQGAIRERTRLAANLHDTLLQTFAGLAYQIEACGVSAPKSQEVFQNQLQTARRMIQRGQDDLRNTVWALHCLPLAEGTFADSVRQLPRRVSVGDDTEICVTCDDDFPVLADFIAGNLLLVIQEAMHNTLKHANATRIEIVLSATSDQHGVSVSVRDDGIGFDVNKRQTSSDGHFGVEGMEQRVERLGGKLVIESQMNVGTTVRADVPLREFDPKIS
jgi:signal transduction histidine kinase